MTDIIDNSSDNGQSDDAMTRLDSEDNQQTLQRESATELATVVLITIQEDFLWDLWDNVGKHKFSRTFMMAWGIVGVTTNIPVLFISQQLIHFHPPYGMIFHSHVHQLIEHIAQHMVS